MNESDKELLQAAGTAVRHLDCFNLKQDLQGWLCKLAFRLNNPLSSPDKDEARHDLRLIASMAAWQPIETAPKDGESFLVWATPMRYPIIAWNDKEGSTVRTYTHWMPLPAAPWKDAV